MTTDATHQGGSDAAAGATESASIPPHSGPEQNDPPETTSLSPCEQKLHDLGETVADYEVRLKLLEERARKKNENEFYDSRGAVSIRAQIILGRETKPLEGPEVVIAHTTYQRVLAEKRSEQARWKATSSTTTFGLLSGAIGLVVLVAGFFLKLSDEVLTEISYWIPIVALGLTLVLAVTGMFTARYYFRKAAGEEALKDLADKCAAEAVAQQSVRG